MNSKEIRFEKSAEKFIKKQTRESQIRLLKAIQQLPEDGDIIKMKGYRSRYRLRVGDFRVQYTTKRDNNNIIVFIDDIDNRGQAYK